MRSPDPKTRDLLLSAAQQIFAEKGFEGATVKEIAEKAGVNISLISYHFKGKEGIFRSCVEEFGSNRLREAESILVSPENVDDLRAKLRLWSIQFLQCHVENDKVCRILHREIIQEHAFMRDIFEHTFLKAFEAMVKFLQAAKKKKILEKEIDPMLATALLYGALIHVGRSKDIQKFWYGTSIENEKYRAQVVDQFIAILLNGIL